MYRKPALENIAEAISEGWDPSDAERGYGIFDYDCTGLLEINAIGDCYPTYNADDGYDDDACAHEAERSGFCKIIPVEELPESFDRRYFGWIDTPENRQAIAEYATKYPAATAR